MIRHSHEAASRTGLPVFTCFSSRQVGKDFGERLTNAIDSIFALGYQRVITIGNDCPMVSTSLLKDVSQQLDENEVVLGPATDGGVYLIGLDRAAWDARTFQALPWQSDSLQEAFAAYYSSISWLETFRDLDHRSDLFAFLQEAPLQHKLRLEIIEIITKPLPVHTSDHSPIPSAFFGRGLSLRAPPY